MPSRKVVAESIADLLSVLSHPYRVRIIRELANKELDVTELRDLLQISQPSVSQHLNSLKSHHMLKQRREGHHIYYSLSEPKMASWLMGALNFVESEIKDFDRIKDAVDDVKKYWKRT